MGVIELQSCNISSDTRVYITEKVIVPMSQINENIPRLEKAWKLVQEGNVILQSNPLRAIVKGSKVNYRVNIAAQDCQCEDHEYRPDLVCKHIRAAQLERQLQIGEITLEVKNWWEEDGSVIVMIVIDHPPMTSLIRQNTVNVTAMEMQNGSLQLVGVYTNETL